MYSGQQPGADAESAHVGRFLWGWVQNPVAVGSIVPSGRELSRLLVRGIGPGSRVLELGSGTGTVTRAILEAGVDPGHLDIVEMDPGFANTLRAKFPNVTLHQMDATGIARQLSHLSGELDCVVSCLPMLLLSRAQRMRVVASIFSMLVEGGVMHQFTYAAFCPIERRMLNRLGLTASRLGVAARNLPPAFAYRIARKSEQGCA